MIPATTRQLTRDRGPFVPHRPQRWPLRDASGRTWAERKALQQAAAR